MVLPRGKKPENGYNYGLYCQGKFSTSEWGSCLFSMAVLRLCCPNRRKWWSKSIGLGMSCGLLLSFCYWWPGSTRGQFVMPCCFECSHLRGFREVVEWIFCELIHEFCLGLCFSLQLWFCDSSNDGIVKDVYSIIKCLQYCKNSGLHISIFDWSSITKHPV